MSLILALLQGALAQEARVEHQVTVKVAQPIASTERLIAKAKSLGGWFVERTDSRVRFRVPYAEADQLAVAAAEEGLVVERAVQRQDLGEQIAQLEALVESRDKVLAQYFALLPTANAKSVVTVEREVLRVVEQLESAKGSLRKLKHEAAYAVVDVAFDYRDRSAPSRGGTSSFDWINERNVQDLLDWFGEQPPRDQRLRTSATAPAGFSAYKKRRVHQSVAADGVRYQVLSARNKPEADLSFWAEALQTRMLLAGYRSIGEPLGEQLDAPGGPVQLLRYGTPLGATDFGYWVGLQVDGRHLIIAEVAGPVDRVEGRAEDLRAALRQIGAP
jgi:hypothetical protein